MLRFFYLILVTALIWVSPLTAQDYPADSILVNSSTNLLEKAAIVPITLWQRFSYSARFMDCQFEPSCSSYMAEAISEQGVLKGLVTGTDRLVRCNPAARHYHRHQVSPQYAEDGRLIDPVIRQVSTNGRKRPGVAAALSIIPGLGRLFAGRPVDGFFSFILVTGLGSNAYYFQRDHRPTAAFLAAAGAALFWVADFYGAYRAAAQSP